MAADRVVTTFAAPSLWPVAVGLSEVGRGVVRRELVADEATLKHLAKALDLQALHSLQATVTVSPWLDGAEVRGRWRASLTQTCVVTLEPLNADLEGDFHVRVVPADSDAAPRPESEITLDPQEEEPPDVLEDDQIDIGGYVVEHLSLDIDPFPRKAGAEFQAPETAEPESPFAVLRRLQTPASDT